MGHKDQAFINSTIETMKELSVPMNILSAIDFRKEFPYIGTTPRNTYVIQRSGSGYLNPRKLVMAELKAAIANGCKFIDEIVNEITDGFDDSGESVHRVRMDSGNEICTRKVLLATGAFTPLRRLLPPGVHPNIGAMAQTVILAEVPEENVHKMRRVLTLVAAIIQLSMWSCPLDSRPICWSLFSSIFI